MTLRDFFYEAGTIRAAPLGVTVATIRTPYDEQLGVITAAAIANTLYKNQGYYVAGAVFEEWITSGAPNTVPPSGHTLTEISYTVLQQ